MLPVSQYRQEKCLAFSPWMRTRMRVSRELSLSTLENTYGPLPKTTTFRTGGGGRQRLFSLPKGVRIPNSIGKLGSGLDIRGEGGYIIIPPSVSHKGGYVWEWPGKPAEAPPWLVELILKVPASSNGTASGSFIGEDGTVIIPDGARDDTLFRLASSFRGKGLPFSAATLVHDQATSWGMDRCS